MILSPSPCSSAIERIRRSGSPSVLAPDACAVTLGRIRLARLEAKRRAAVGDAFTPRPTLRGAVPFSLMGERMRRAALFGPGWAPSPFDPPRPRR